MIIDTSVLVAILKSEPEELELSQALYEADEVYLPAPTAVEAYMVIKRHLGDQGIKQLKIILELFDIKPLPFNHKHIIHAYEAIEQFGKGGGSGVKLNFGDCLVYGASKAEEMPLLFKGKDFSKTDVEIAKGSIFL